MNKIKLLFVEDDEALSFMVKGSLELKGTYEIYTAENGKEGLEQYRKIYPDIIVADVEMREMSGFEMVKEIRTTDRHIPVIFASGLKSPTTLIEGLNLGADNFIRKPYLPEELHIQILALLRRVKEGQAGGSKEQYSYDFGNFRLNTQLRYLTLRENGNIQLKLTEREVDILKILLEKQGEVVKKEEILIPLWGNSDYFAARSLDVFMSKIRKYLEADNSVEIQTIRGEGLRLIIYDEC